MHLMQIHEPGQTPIPHAQTVAIGIDLGTTHSVVALLREDGSPQAISDEQGRSLIPSVVSYENLGRRVGHEAGEGAVRSIKRLMGKSSSDAVVKDFPNVIAASSPLALQCGPQHLSPEEISADILAHLKHMAEAALGHNVDAAVITVPAYFDDAQRLATKRAAELSGLRVLRLINEPTAAALAYGLDQGAEGTIAVYDLGGGTFDISILKLSGGVFQVLATAGDTLLGGDDIDHALADYALSQWKITLPPHPRAQFQLACRRAKEQLSDATEVMLTHADKHLTITRELLNELAAPLIKRSLACCTRALLDAKIGKEELSAVVLVGGSTRLKLVHSMVAEFFGQTPHSEIDPDRVVAYGAAIQAAALTQGADHLLLDVVPLSLGLEMMGGIVEKIIHRNTPIPTSVKQEFTTYADGQTAIALHIVQGEREKAEDCRSLARCELTGIAPMKAGLARVGVTFSVDADGLLSVEAREALSGSVQQVEIKPSYGLSVEDMARMLEQAMQHAQSDILERLLIESRVEAQRVVMEIQSALKDTPQHLKAGEAAMIEAQIASVNEALQGSERERIDYESGRLQELVGPFAERRMNAAIAEGLSGKHLTEV